MTVFRDARHIVTADVSTMTREDLVEAMTGEAVLAQTDLRPPVPSTPDVVLRVHELTGRGFDDLSFQAHAHEIVGLAGSGGSRKYEIANAIVGLDRPFSGSVTVGHTALGDGNVLGALRAGVGFTPQDRHESGFVPGLGIGENLTMTVPHRLGRRGVVRPGRREEFARSLIAELDVVPAEPGYPVGQLSGGNQQKVVAGRAIADTPRLLVLMAPTAGVDVKSRTSLMDTAVRSAERGAAVLVVTDDLDDLRYCHRVLVLHRGRIVTELHDSWTDQQVVAAMEGMTASE